MRRPRNTGSILPTHPPTHPPLRRLYFRHARIQQESSTGERVAIAIIIVIAIFWQANSTNSAWTAGDHLMNRPPSLPPSASSHPPPLSPHAHTPTQRGSNKPRSRFPVWHVQCPAPASNPQSIYSNQRHSVNISQRLVFDHTCLASLRAFHR